MAEIQFDDQVDITDKVCPLTFVKAKVAIEELDDGEVLAIRMNDGEPKGAAGQAIQNMNIMFGLDEKTGLMLAPAML